MPAPTPLNITLFENTLYTWFKDQTGLNNIRWADQDAPVSPYPFGLITPLTGLLINRNAFDYTTNTFDTLISNISETYNVVLGVSDTLLIISSYSSPITVTLTAGSRTAAQIVSDINSTPLINVIASDVGGKVQIVSNNGKIFSIGGNASSLFDFDVLVLNLNKRGYREITVSFQAYVGPPDNNNPSLNANFLLSLAQGSLQLNSVIDTFLSNNISVIQDFGVTRLDQVIEDKFVSVANLDVRFMAASSVFEPISYINKTKISSELSYGSNTVTEQDKEFGII